MFLKGFNSFKKFFPFTKKKKKKQKKKSISDACNGLNSSKYSLALGETQHSTLETLFSMPNTLLTTQIILPSPHGKLPRTQGTRFFHIRQSKDFTTEFLDCELRKCTGDSDDPTNSAQSLMGLQCTLNWRLFAPNQGFVKLNS